MTKTGNGKRVELKNPHLEELSDDKLYHFGMNKLDYDFEKKFGDVKVNLLLKKISNNNSLQKMEKY